MKALFLFLSLFFVLLNGYSQSTNNSTEGKRVGITKPRIGKITPTTFDIILDGKVFETVEYRATDSVEKESYSTDKIFKTIEIGIDKWELSFFYSSSVKQNYFKYFKFNSKELSGNYEFLIQGLNFRNFVFRAFLQRYYFISAEN